MKIYYLTSNAEYFYVICFASNEMEAIKKANKRFKDITGLKFTDTWYIEEFTRDTYDGVLAFY